MLAVRQDAETLDDDDTEEQTATQEIAPLEQARIHQSLVQSWVQTLRAAESMHARLYPRYVRHSEAELATIVERAFRNRRGPSHMVAEMLAEGSRSIARPLRREAWA